MEEIKLRTLKDIVKEYKNQDKIDFDFTLKAEAIKWVKGMNNARYGDGKNFRERLEPFKDFYDDEYDSFEEVTNWIKEFFNLTEEDLK